MGKRIWMETAVTTHYQSDTAVTNPRKSVQSVAKKDDNEFE